MKQQFNKCLFKLIIAAFAVVSLTSCKKDAGSKPADYSKAPRKPAPAALVGNWVHTEVSGTNIEYNGHSMPAYLFGVTFHIEADGTGWQAITSTVNTYTSSNKEDVNSDCTYEIELENGNEIIFKSYTIQGKVYDNDHYSHPLAPEKCYPATYTISECTFGEDSRGVFFAVNDSGKKYYKQ